MWCLRETISDKVCVTTRVGFLPQPVPPCQFFRFRIDPKPLLLVLLLSSSFFHKDEKVYVGHNAVAEAGKRIANREVSSLVATDQKPKKEATSSTSASTASCSDGGHRTPFLLTNFDV